MTSQPGQKTINKVDFKIYDVTAWSKNNCNTYIAQYPEN